MDTLYSPQSRAERFIAAGRVVLATSSMFAVWLDPTEPAKFARVAYSLLAAYVVYSSFIALLVWRSDDPAGPQRAVTHAVDLAFFSLFIFFTAGPASPFTAYFVFSMVCATLRWQWRGVLWTAAASIGAYLAVTVFLANVALEDAIESYRLIIRVVYLGVIAVLLGYLGAHEERTRREISRLAAWPRLGPQRLEPAVRALLEHAAGVIGAPSAVLAWVESEEPWLYLASWRRGQFSWSRESPEDFDPLVTPPLDEASFLSPEDDSPPTILYQTAAGLARWRGQPLHAGLRERLGPGPVLGVRLRAGSFEGHLLLAGRAGMTSDDLLLAEAVAGMVAARLDSVYLTRVLAESAATEERIRLARDLHDGVLQSLTGVGLRLEGVRRLIREDTGEADEQVEELQNLLALEQRDLRFFIEELKPQPAASAGSAGLARQISDLVQRLELEWGLRVELAADGLEAEIPEGLEREIYLIVREALVNAVRHGDASQVAVEIHARGDRVTIAVSDNGSGFPFDGSYSHAELVRRNLGPRNLRERVSALNGTVALDTSRSGARLEILLPLWEAAG